MNTEGNDRYKKYQKRKSKELTTVRYWIETQDGVSKDTTRELYKDSDDFWNLDQICATFFQKIKDGKKHYNAAKKHLGLACFCF